MPDPIELDPVDELGAGAVGEPGQRAFYIQARSEAAPAHRAGREGAGRAARDRGRRVPRPHRRPVPRGPDQPARRPWPSCASRRSRCSAPGSSASASIPSASWCSSSCASARPTTTTRDDRRGARRGARATRRDDADDEEEGYVARIYATRPQVRAMAARGAEAVAGGPPAVPALRHADGPRRTPVPPLELTRRPGRRGARPRASSRSSGRMRYSSNGTFLVRGRAPTASRCPRSTSRAAASGRCGTSPTARCASARSPRTCCPTRSVGASCRSRCCATTGRSASGALQRFVEHDPEEHYFTLLDEQPGPVPPVRGLRRPRQQHRPQGRPLPARPRQRRDRSASTTGSRSIRCGSCAPSSGTSPASRCRAALARRRVPRRSPSSTTVRSASALAALLSPPELAARRDRAPTDLLRDGHFPTPTPATTRSLAAGLSRATARSSAVRS